MESRSYDESVFLVSLDFELAWGFHELPDHQKRVEGARQAVTEILRLFREYRIHASWATVGLLFAKNKTEMHQYAPDNRPSYNRSLLSPYGLLDAIPDTEDCAPSYYAESLIRSILSTPHQEIGSHTFSHYYAMEPGQTEEEFIADLQAAKSIARSKGIALSSLVFPKNQCDDRLISCCTELGFKAYRGNQSHTVYQARSRAQDRSYHRAIQLMDSHMNLTGHHTYPLPQKTDGMLNLPGSAFLRPCGASITMLDRLRLRRICQSMKYAAVNNQIYHLWWHPHNFAKHLQTNLSFLRSILDYFTIMQSQYSMQSMNMAECAEIACSVSS